MKPFPVTLALLCAGLTGCGTPTWSQASTSNAPRKHVVIQFSDASLHPSQARVQSGGNVAWTNYSSSFGAVFLPMETAQALGCKSMRPIFGEVAGGYLSETISPEDEDVSLPCNPADGTYQYEVRLSMDADGIENPDSVMPGTIVVGGAP